MSACARPPEGTLGARIWHLLRESGPMTIPELAEYAPHSQDSIRRACYALVDRGLLWQRTIRHATFYCAVGDKAPADLRGTRAASRNNRGARAYAKWVVMMRKRHGPQWRPPVRDPLLLAWPMPVEVRT